MTDDQPTVGHPTQREVFDLAEDNKHIDNAPSKAQRQFDKLSPAAIMRELGFAPNKYCTPLQFCVMVYNDDIDIVFKNERRRKRYHEKGGIAMAHRIACATAAMKYFHMEMPKISIEQGDQNDEKFAAQMASAGDRLVRKRVILETVQRIAPSAPLSPASYPPVFEEAIKGELMEEDSAAEGDTDYDPDRDD